MGAIQVKNVPPEVHRALRERALAEGTTVSGYVLDVLRRDLAGPSRGQWLSRVAGREPVEVDVVGALDAERASRESHLVAGRRRR